MIWLLIITLTAVVFTLRYIFLIPQLPIRLPLVVRQALKGYSAPCLLTAICAPVILLENHELRSFPIILIYGALFCVIVASVLKNMLLTVGLTLVFFYSLIYFIG
ncbi:AzlD domain-containing protein [Providencia hangzhouensis]